MTVEELRDLYELAMYRYNETMRRWGDDPRGAMHVFEEKYRFGVVRDAYRAALQGTDPDVALAMMEIGLLRLTTL